MTIPSVTAESVLGLFRLIAGREERRTSGESAKKAALHAISQQLEHTQKAKTKDRLDEAVRVGGLLLRAEMINNDADTVALDLLSRLRRRK